MHILILLSNLEFYERGIRQIGFPNRHALVSRNFVSWAVARPGLMPLIIKQARELVTQKNAEWWPPAQPSPAQPPPGHRQTRRENMLFLLHRSHTTGDRGGDA